mgnify:CR=1 FL=1
MVARHLILPLRTRVTQLWSLPRLLRLPLILRAHPVRRHPPRVPNLRPAEFRPTVLWLRVLMTPRFLFRALPVALPPRLPRRWGTAPGRRSLLRWRPPSLICPRVPIRRAAILNGSSSQVRTDPGSPNGVKATEAQITRNMDKSSPLLPILVTLGGGLILGALGMSRMHTSKKD